MKHIIKMENPQELLVKLQNTLMLIETKGLGVEHLYNAMATVKQIHDSIISIPSEEDKKNAVDLTIKE